MNIENLTSLAISACIYGGQEIMSVYNTDFDFELKKDNSPLTIADKKCNKKIEEILYDSKIPILSEEGKQLSYEERKNWKYLWIVDPLDGTKEFIKKNGEFSFQKPLTKKIIITQIHSSLIIIIEKFYFLPAIGKEAMAVWTYGFLLKMTTEHSVLQ